MAGDNFGSIGAKGNTAFHRFATSFAGRLVYGYVSGGIASEATGGDFLMGAATGAIVSLANHWLHGINNGGSEQNEAYTLNVNRFADTDDSTVSTFELVRNSDGKVVNSGYILEPGGPDTTESNQDKRIPEGSYSARYWGYSNSLGYKYIISNFLVSESRTILLHVGNTHKNTSGCFLIGSSYSKVNGNFQVSNSRNVNKSFYNIIGNTNFTINISNDSLYPYRYFRYPKIAPITPWFN